MAIKEIKREWSPCQLDYVKTYLLHSEKDVADLPKCCVGSKATVSETDNEYYCTADGWKLGSELGGDSSSPVVILPETAFSPVDGNIMVVEPILSDIIPRATYEVIFNGVRYEGVAEKVIGTGNPVVIGNPEIMGGSNIEGSPFLIMVLGDPMDMDGDGNPDVYAMIMDLDGSEEVTLAINKIADPDPGYSYRVLVDLDSTDTPTSDKTFAEIRAAYLSGKLPYVVARRLVYHLRHVDSVEMTFVYCKSIGSDEYYIKFKVDGSIESTY